MGCCMYNLEKNVPVEIRGCTAFAYSKGGKIIYGRNNDLPPYLRDGSKSEIYTPKDGNRFNITTSSFINGEEGLNEHGLAVAMTFVMNCRLLLIVIFCLQIKAAEWLLLNVHHQLKRFGKLKNLVRTGLFVRLIVLYLMK